MKALLIFCLVLFVLPQLYAQQLSVKSFNKLPNDLDARVNEPIKDPNGYKCAIIKVVTTQTGFSFDCGQIGIIKTIQKPSEIWVYIPYGAKRLTISHPNLGILRDYQIPQAIEKATSYELVLISGNVVITVDETIVSQWVVITPEPADAMVYLNDKFVIQGIFQSKLKPGKYTYRVEAPMYHNDGGRFDLTDSKKELNVVLKPAFGYLSVTSEPETGARVMIDGKVQPTTTPFQSEPIISGVHTIQVSKEMYEPATQKVNVIDGQTITVKLKMNPTFAELNINVPAEAEVFIQNQSKGTGPWQGRLNTGVYSLEARIDKHRSAKKDIDLSAGDQQFVELKPTPIFGSVDVITKPTGASITIDSKDYGKTPNTIANLLIGDYIIELSKQGYSKAIKQITIAEGKTAELNEVLTIDDSSTTQMTSPKQNESSIAKGKSNYGGITELKPNFSADYYKYRKRKTIWLVSTLASGAAGTFFYLQSKSAYSQYQTATTEAVSLQDKVELYNKIYPICFGAAGLCAFEFIVNSIKQNKAKGQKLSFYPQPIPQGGGIGLAYKF